MAAVLLLVALTVLVGLAFLAIVFGSVYGASLVLTVLLGETFKGRIGRRPLLIAQAATFLLATGAAYVWLGAHPGQDGSLMNLGLAVGGAGVGAAFVAAACALPLRKGSPVRGARVAFVPAGLAILLTAAAGGVIAIAVLPPFVLGAPALLLGRKS